MAKGQMILTIILMIMSLFLFASSIVWMISKAIRNKKAPEKYNKAGVSTALVFSGFVLLSIWLLRFAVGYFAIVVSKDGTMHLTPLEEFANSLFKALRTFSMEEEYAEYIMSIKALIVEVVPNTHWSFSIIKTVAIVYASVLNLIAPVVGGAIILEILASVFPKMGLRWSYFFIKRPKYFFSELNPASLSLAKSIYNKEKSEKPILIFTDTYVDNEKEKEYELLLEARKYGAICIRDDLAHVRKAKYGKRAYFLMEENEFGNLQTLMGLTEDHNVKYIRDAYIYLFVQSDAYVQVEKQINEEFKEEKKKELLKGSEKPTIVPVNGYRNLVQNLFVEIPLYEPLINKKDNTKLNVTILGNGIIGTEAFLNAYWFGQMMISRDDNGKKSMSECEMTINVVSKDSEEVFWSKIDYVNPEIKGTVEVLGNCIDSNENELLCYDSAGHKNNPYCRVRYIQADVKVGGFWDSDSEEMQQLLDSDYFIVALGNDADNISVGDKLRLLIGKKHLTDADEIVGQVIIAYAVFNSDLVKTLNNQRHYQCRSKGRNDIYMYAFGGLENVYSYDNIYMSKYKLLAEGTGAAYDKSQMHQKHIDDHIKRSKNDNKNYSHWADLARAMHIKYKVFSLGLVDKSVFDYSTTQLHGTDIEDKCKLYQQVVLNQSKEELSDDLKLIYDDIHLKQHLLAWLEHRRWTAFTRTMGYQYSGEFKKNLQLNGENHKNMELKLHPCLIEAKKPVLYSDNNYINESWQKMFDMLSLSKELEALNKKIENLNKEEMLSLLTKKKEYLESKSVLFSKYRETKKDLLDRLTFEWCEEATLVSLSMIEKGLKYLSDINFVVITQETEEKFLEAWNGIYCYDFKTYDYYTFDYDKE